jgi:hypothetical protein
MAVDRKLVVPLVEKYFPKDGTLVEPGKIGIDHICKDWTGGGTTCGFLPHWLLWRLGCKDTKLINRYEPDTAFTYTDGANLNRFLAHTSFTRVAFPDTGWGARAKGVNDEMFLNRTAYPNVGDAVIIQGNRTAKGVETSHIFVILEEPIWDANVKGKGTWRIAETGQAKGGSGHLATRGFEFKNGRWWVNAEGKAADRWMIGWLDISKLEFGPQLKYQNYLNSFSSLAASTAASKLINTCWDITSKNGEKWTYYFLKGYRCFLAHPSSPRELIGDGHWLPNGSGITIHWNLYQEESITELADKTAKGTDAYGQWTGKKSTFTKNTKFRSSLAV